MAGGHASRAERKQAQIARAARALFLEQGYAGTTMEAVAGAATVSKQTLYSYFPSKADLLTAIVTDELAALRPGAGHLPEVTSLAGLRAILLRLALDSTARLMTDDAQQLLRLVVGEAFRVPELRDVVRGMLPGQFFHDVEGLIRSAADAGLVRAARPDLSARMFVGPVASFVTLDGLFRADGAIPPDEEALAFIVDAFLATIQVDQRR